GALLAHGARDDVVVGHDADALGPEGGERGVGQPGGVRAHQSCTDPSLSRFTGRCARSSGVPTKPWGVVTRTVTKVRPGLATSISTLRMVDPCTVPSGLAGPAPRLVRTCPLAGPPRSVAVWPVASTVAPSALT